MCIEVTKNAVIEFPSSHESGYFKKGSSKGQVESLRGKVILSRMRRNLSFRVTSSQG